MRINIKEVACFIVLMSIFTSCEDFLTVDGPKSKVEQRIVFSSDVTATSAMIGVYVDMLNLSGFASGSNKSLSSLPGLSADELKPFSTFNVNNYQFQQNELIPQNLYMEDLWNSMYKIIYETNSLLEGIEASEHLSPEVVSQLKGEALFVRAFTNFYLTNLFGDVPIVTTTDYKINAVVSRSTVSSVYEHILEDLLLSKQLLKADYVTLDEDGTPARTRPNRFAVSALLSRVYLYLEQWENAEGESSELLESNDMYSLVSLSEVFLKNSQEAIWQLRPRTSSTNTGYANEAYYFINFRSYNVLTDTVLNAFEDGDQRRVEWVRNTGVSYYPYKYRQNLATSLSEYSMIFRLAEQYLIRAEARANLDNLTGAIADLDAIRDRAGLPLIQNINPSISQDELLELILHERQIELFTEWGHRWFDLIRTGNADNALGQKEFWDNTDVLYPIPQAEFRKNPFLGDQNPGY